jgi:hypothetical protein
MADECLQELRTSETRFLPVLIQYDDYFRRDLWRNAPLPGTFSLLLFLNAYQLFLAGARMALSGHPAAIFPLMRSALESASYGFLMEQQPALSEIWSNRHRSQADKAACRDAFSFHKAIAGLKDKAPDVHGLAKEAYQAAIDYGAHPNVRGVVEHLTVDEERPDRMVSITHASLYSAGHRETIRGLGACLDYGFLIISIIALACPAATGALQTELQTLNDAKNAAIAAYQSLAEQQ